MLSHVRSLCRPGLQFQNSASAPTSLILFQCTWYLCVGSLIEQCACVCPCAHACVCVCVHAGVVTISSNVDSDTSANVTNLFFETGSKRCTCKWTLASKLDATDCSTWLCKVYKLFVLSLKLEIWNIFEPNCPFKTSARCDEGTWWWICRRLLWNLSQAFSPLQSSICFLFVQVLPKQRMKHSHGN